MWRSAHVFLATAGRPFALISQLQKLHVRGLVDCAAGSLRIVGIAGDRGKVKHYFWRDETLPFGLSVIADDRRYADLERAIRDAGDAERSLGRRLKRFAQSYLGLDKATTEEDGTKKRGDSKKKAEIIRGFIGELVGFRKVKRGKESVTIPLYTDFWSEIAPLGERIACDGFAESRWAEILKKASEAVFSAQ